MVLARQTPCVFLFDSYERTSLSATQWNSNSADRWITSQLLTRIRDWQLTNTVVVLAGRRLPDFGAEWSQVSGRLPLDPLSIEDVAEYLRNRRGMSNLTYAEVGALFKATEGNPQLVGIIGDNLEQASRTSGATDDVW